MSTIQLELLGMGPEISQALGDIGLTVCRLAKSDGMALSGILRGPDTDSISSRPAYVISWVCRASSTKFWSSPMLLLTVDSALAKETSKERSDRTLETSTANTAMAFLQWLLMWVQAARYRFFVSMSGLAMGKWALQCTRSVPHMSLTVYLGSEKRAACPASPAPRLLTAQITASTLLVLMSRMGWISAQRTLPCSAGNLTFYTSLCGLGCVPQLLGQPGSVSYLRSHHKSSQKCCIISKAKFDFCLFGLTILLQSQVVNKCRNETCYRILSSKSWHAECIVSRGDCTKELSKVSALPVSLQQQLSQAQCFDRGLFTAACLTLGTSCSN